VPPRKTHRKAPTANRIATQKAPRRAATAQKQETVVEPVAAVRSFWSGSLSFGLVSIPVSLVAAQRHNRVALRMLSKDGTPLRRRFFCSEDAVALDAADIVRGYEIEKDRFVVVTDDELKAVAPKLSQEIDLRRFVPLADIDPMYFEHGYFLIPGKGSGKAYRLLAHVMEERARAGIATFVMRGKQYLIAIIARGGLLRAETLRFADELRTSADVGLGAHREADGDAVADFDKRIRALRADALDDDALEDAYARDLLALIAKKRRAGRDVVAAPAAPDEDAPTSAEVVDLMKYLKDSIVAADADTRERKQPHAATRKVGTKQGGKQKASAPAAKRRSTR
jgi:DNA end-binding protein Ku